MNLSLERSLGTLNSYFLLSMGLSEKNLGYRFGVRKEFQKAAGSSQPFSYCLSFEGDNELECVLKAESKLKKNLILKLGFWLSLLPGNDNPNKNMFPLFFGMELN